jgi:transcriptional regulator with XRE-family HTH domain
MDIYEQLGKRIEYLRKKKNLSQLNLALNANINKNYLSDLERGKRNPSLLILNRLARALELSLSELFQGVIDFSYEDIVETMSSIK